MTDNKTIIYEPIAERLPQAVASSIALSKENGASVRFKFNEVTITVKPDSNQEEVISFYHSESERLRKEYENSPEGKAAFAKAERMRQERIKRNAEVDAKISGVSMDIANEEAWDACVAASNKSIYEGSTARYAERWAKLMQVEMADGKKLADVAEKARYDADSEGTSGNSYASAAHILAATWRHSEEFCSWYNENLTIRLEEAARIAGNKTPALDIR